MIKNLVRWGRSETVSNDMLTPRNGAQNVGC